MMRAVVSTLAVLFLLLCSMPESGPHVEDLEPVLVVHECVVHFGAPSKCGDQIIEEGRLVLQEVSTNSDVTKSP